MDFVLTSTLISLGKLAIALGAMAAIGKMLEKALGFDMEGAVDALETNAHNGKALPLAIVLAAIVVTIGGILQRFL